MQSRLIIFSRGWGAGGGEEDQKRVFLTALNDKKTDEVESATSRFSKKQVLNKGFCGREPQG